MKGPSGTVVVLRLWSICAFVGGALIYVDAETAMHEGLAALGLLVSALTLGLGAILHELQLMRAERQGPSDSRKLTDASTAVTADPGPGI